MELTKQVCSLELAKRLKGLGVKQESLFWWGSGIPGAGILKKEQDFDLGSLPIKLNGNWTGHFSAFTVAELGEMLPSGLEGIKGLPGTTLHVGRSYPDKWVCGYAVYVQWATPPYLSWNGCEIADTEADACATMLIYLLENKLITA